MKEVDVNQTTTNLGALPEAVLPKKRIKRTQNFKNHIAVRKETFEDFKNLKDEPGSDAFMKKLLALYSKYSSFKEKKTKNENK